MNAINFRRAVQVGLGLLLVALSAGCANSPSWGAWSKRPTDAEIAAVLGRVDAGMYSQQKDIRQNPSAVLAAASR